MLTGAGTGGHLFPLLPVAKELRSMLGPETEFIYLGPLGDLERRIMGDAGIRMMPIQAGKWRRYFDLRNVTDIFRVIFGFVKSLVLLYRIMPDAVFSKGAYAAVPVVFAAWIYRIPIMTQDSDATPGVANKIMGKFADRVSVAYPSAAQFFEPGRVAITGNPIREGILLGSPDRGRNRFGCPSGKQVLLVLGGSLGARSLNFSIVKILPRLLSRFFVIHQTGSANHEEVTKRIGELALGDLQGRYFSAPFFETEEIADALFLSDLIVSRAGANTVSEIAAVGKSSILVPLPSAANDEQRMNAYEIARAGGTLVLEESNLGENLLFGKIEGLMDDASLREKMSQAVRAFYHPDAATRIASEIVSLIREKESYQTVFDRLVERWKEWRNRRKG